MPIINIPETLPAKKTLEFENIFVITKERAIHQDIRPLKIVILNLMPKKIETETQLLRLLGNSPLQVDVDLLQTATHVSKNTSSDHLLNFYQVFDNIKSKKYDGLIITGAPVELMEFEDVNYWEELKCIMEWSLANVYSTLHICWGAQAGLYYHYGVKKENLPDKMFGVFPHHVTDIHNMLVRGFDETFYVPHSRHTRIDEDFVRNCKDLKVLTYSDISGINCVSAKDGRQVFVCGHSEYDKDTLANEYFRDKNAGLPINVPYNYFKEDDINNDPAFIWRGHANLFFQNWLNFVYQETPFDLSTL